MIYVKSDETITRIDYPNVDGGVELCCIKSNYGWRKLSNVFGTMLYHGEDKERAR